MVALPEQPWGVSLRRILESLGESVVQVRLAPRGLDVPVRDVAIWDAEDPVAGRPGELGLLIGARGRAAVAVVRSAGARGAVAVAVKLDTDGAGDAGQALLDGEARDAGVALLGVPLDVRWDQLESLVRGVIAPLAAESGDERSGDRGDLFSLAQTIAAVTSGAVSIEDSASRVLAYSSTGDDVDELRRLSILGRKGPEQYLAMLREWGVYERLRTRHDAVRIAARPELGISERLAIGIHAGGRQLGTIWVAAGSEPIPERAEHALVGAARVAAVQLARRQHAPDSGGRFRERLLVGLLEGRVAADAAAEQLGVDPDGSVVVLAFTGAEHGPSDRSQLELLRGELLDLIAMHSAAYRRDALVTQLDGRAYVVLPDVERSPAGEAAVLAFARDAVASARRHLGSELTHPVQAAVGSVAPTLAEAPRSRGECDRVLDVIGGDAGTTVAAIDEVRAEVLLAEIAAMLEARPAARDPRVSALRLHDARHGGQLVPTLLTYLDRLGDVRAAADELGVHPNTVRYRLRRIVQVSGLDLDDPPQRLFAHVQLALTAQ
ncbi:helix-turn-helix domain-containing protein [Haloechinothrix sp. LS1_15]|uniref:PucR family transcriptional regulator n=1 Tax=Haloechinothrix sp. LS1_15 TaxID=2652248 RepID=UPI0029459BC2|nr:helix-turn-helix domain-containing protein [Haloechinothrix sp. LS1_15]MDV6013750.1 PucR family transcriptional regulator [Haloechinothrix sp. LS1_15]